MFVEMECTLYTSCSTINQTYTNNLIELKTKSLQLHTYTPI
jgi:hypothetical protein